jgi:hypothetical protein
LSFTLIATLESDSSEHAPSPQPRELNMSKPDQLDPLAPRPNLDFSKGVRGKYANHLNRESNVVLIAPDLLDTFPDSQSVNEALRTLKRLTATSAPPARRKQRTSAAS